MAQIKRNSDGTYSKVYSDVEVALVRQANTEKKNRIETSANLYEAYNQLSLAIMALEAGAVDITQIQESLTTSKNIIDDHATRIDNMEQVSATDVYDRSQVRAIMVPWKVEEIAHTFDTPTHEMFNKTNLFEKKTGYAHFENADINIPNGFELSPNTMRRYSIWVHTSDPKIVQFQIRYGDRCVITQNNVQKAVYTTPGGNFDGTAKMLSMHFEAGWTLLQFMVANESQEGGLVVKSDLFKQADGLSSLDYASGLIDGTQIQPGTVGEKQLATNMNLKTSVVTSTAKDKPAGVFGDASTNGSIQVGDGLVKKSKNEPFVFNDDVRIQGQLLVEGINLESNAISITSLSKYLEVTNDDEGWYMNLTLTDFVQRSDLKTITEAITKLNDSIIQLDGRISTIETHLNTTGI